MSSAGPLFLIYLSSVCHDVLVPGQDVVFRYAARVIPATHPSPFCFVIGVSQKLLCFLYRAIYLFKVCWVSQLTEGLHIISVYIAWVTQSTTYVGTCQLVSQPDASKTSWSCRPHLHEMQGPHPQLQLDTLFLAQYLATD